LPRRGGTPARQLPPPTILTLAAIQATVSDVVLIEQGQHNAGLPPFRFANHAAPVGMPPVVSRRYAGGCGRMLPSHMSCGAKTSSEMRVRTLLVIGQIGQDLLSVRRS